VVAAAAERGIEPRRGVFLLLAGLAVCAFVLALVAVGVIAYLAYDTQTSRVAELEEATESQSRRVAELEATDEEIVEDHVQIGEAFAGASQQLRRVAGIVTGRSVRLPPRLTSLQRFRRLGFLTPRSLPGSLAAGRRTIARYRDGYRVTWPNGVSLFASSTRDVALRALISESSPRARSAALVGRRAVTRIDGPLVIYAWRDRGRSYTVLAPRPLDSLARALIRRLR
jgi:hypothetical protein